MSKKTAATDPSKILRIEVLKEQIGQHRRQAHQIVFTNGCFDLLHVGHVRYLKTARSYGDILVVGLNSDKSVKQIKGPKRPINSQNHRAEVLASLDCIDYITIFKEPDPLMVIKQIQPDILVKGGDWPESRIIGASEVRARSGQVVRVPVVPGISTTRLLDRISAGAPW